MPDETEQREGAGPAAERQVSGLAEGLRDQFTVLLGPQGHVETWSPSAEHVTGYTADEAVGRHLSFLYPPEELAAGEPTHDLARAEIEGQFEREARRIRNGGARFLGRVAITSLRGRGGTVRGFVLVIRDLTEVRRMGEMLRLSEERFRLLVESIEDYAIFMLDPHGRITSWNGGAARLKGYTLDEILGQSIERFYTDEDRAARRPWRLLRAASEEGRVEDEGWRVRKDGSLFWADVVITAMRGPGGELVGFAKITRDLTARREAETQLRLSEERFRLLIEGVRDYAIFMLDPTGRVVTWNAGAERIEGYTADEVVGEHVSLFYPEEDVRAGAVEREMEIATRDGRFEDEGWRVRKDGTRYWSSLLLTALRDREGRLVGYGWVTRDLTQRRKVEQDRLRLAQAEEAISLRDEFLSIVSHELKTPLTALQLQIQGLQRKVSGPDPALAARLGRAAHSGQRLADLIEALLDVSRIASGRFELRRDCLDLADLCHEVAERLRDTAARSGCELHLDVPRGLLGAWDRVRMEQVLSNLVSNAIKYGAGSPIELVAEGQDHQAVLQVRDHGPGIPEEDLQRIFGRFERAVSMRHYGGLGLGLYVARQIVEAHGGTVEASNDPGGGARLIVRLPVLACQPSPDSHAPGDLH